VSTSQPAASSPAGRPAGPPGASDHPGQRLGLPRQGRGSTAGWRRRIGALFIDWFASLAAASLVFGRGVLASNGWESWTTMLVFWLEVSLLTALVGGSFGQLVVRIAVVRLDRRPLSLLMAMLRTLLICLVVPPVIYNRDQRGLHDLVAGTIVVRR
jgi:uncharacterized RDD family membrane protein YckC